MANISRLREEIIDDLGDCPYTDKQLEEIVEEEETLVTVKKQQAAIQKTLDELQQKTAESFVPFGMPMSKVEIPLDGLKKELGSAIRESIGLVQKATERMVAKLTVEVARAQVERTELRKVLVALSRVEPPIVQIPDSLGEIIGQAVQKAIGDNRPEIPAPNYHVTTPKVLKTIHKRDEDGNITETEYVYET